MAFVGGFVASGAVGLWGILAPLGALVFNGARAGVRWFVAFVAVFLVSGTVGELAGGGAALPGLVRADDDRAQRDRRRRRRLRAPGAVRAPARGGGRGAARSSRTAPRPCCSTSSPARSPTGSRPTPPRSRTSSPRHRSCSPTSSTSRRCRTACSRPRWSASSTTCSRTSTSSPTDTGSRRSRRSVTATWSLRGCRRRARTTPG